MNSSVSLLITGSEITEGRLQDSNSFYLAGELTRSGYIVSHTVSAADNPKDIKSALEFLASKSEVIIVTGGLGPTDDDITREVVAEFAGTELEFDEEVFKIIEQYFNKRGRRLSPANRRQAFFPAGSEIIYNNHGTAPGFRIDLQDPDTVSIFVLPGVPSEMKIMATEAVFPELDKLLQKKSLHYELLRITGRSESFLGETVEACHLGSAVSVSYRASFPEIQLRFSSEDSSVLAEAVKKVRCQIGEEHIFSTDSEMGLVESVVELLQNKSQTLSLVESCTGGLIGEMITSVSGCSSCFLGGVIAYSNESKQNLLGVPEKVITQNGAVSRETAEFMAAAGRKKYDSTLALSVTGIAGPEGGTPEKPVGTFYISLVSEQEKYDFHFCYTGRNREIIRSFAAASALNIIRRYLKGYPLDNLPYLK